MRFRPRCSLRTLAIGVTLVCAYFGAWEATKRYGIPNSLRTVEEAFHESSQEISYTRVISARSPLPLIICQEESSVEGLRSNSDSIGRQLMWEHYIGRQYYLWLFGPKFKLPYEPDS